MSALFNKSCDRCRAKKTRCISLNESECAYCKSRGLPCIFSYQKRRRRRRNDQLAQVATISDLVPHPGTRTASHHPSPSYQPNPATDTRPPSSPELYIDYLLKQGPLRQTGRSDSTQDQLTTLIGPSPNISFFPAKRVHAISRKLGHNRLDHLLEAIRAVIASKLKNSGFLVTSDLGQETCQDAGNAHDLAMAPVAKEYIKTYMELVHPLYPFLCRREFEERASAPGLMRDLVTNKCWACLYYAVLAVGCQHSDGGSYEAKKGPSWVYFERALSYVRELVFPRGPLTSVQALMAIALFCQSISAFDLESSMIAEAAVMAQSLGINRSTAASDSPSVRTFWVLYYMEKTSCFTAGRVPSIQDSHISCPLPSGAESSFHDYDWLISFIKYSRLISKIQSQLFTITSITQPYTACQATVQNLQSELEAWRQSVPYRFRPGEPLRPRLLVEPSALSIALRAHYYYRYAYITLIWTLLHCAPTQKELSHESDLKSELMQTARGVLELTSYIEISPSTPVWILALTPISALMILFDLVIHNPNHPETNLNLALLDVASGHFSRVEYSSKGVLPGSLISEFAHLAREYVAGAKYKMFSNSALPSAAGHSSQYLSQAWNNEADNDGNSGNSGNSTDARPSLPVDDSKPLTPLSQSHISLAHPDQDQYLATSPQRNAELTTATSSFPNEPDPGSGMPNIPGQQHQLFSALAGSLMCRLYI